jgi:hypothetical protein
MNARLDVPANSLFPASLLAAPLKSNLTRTPLCSGKSRDQAGRWSLDRAFDVILNREGSFGVTSKAVKENKEWLPLWCHFGPILHRFHRVATCIPASKLRIIIDESL